MSEMIESGGGIHAEEVRLGKIVLSLQDIFDNQSILFGRCLAGDRLGIPLVFSPKSSGDNFVGFNCRNGAIPPRALVRRARTRPCPE